MNFDIFDIEDAGATEAAPPTIIKVVGVGGGGGNAVNRMIAAGLKKIDFVALNTDVQALQRSNAETRIVLGRELTGGLGAGGIPEVGEKAAIESKEEIKKELEKADMVFIAAGMGGGTGTGAAAIIAEVAKNAGALTVAAVTTPFAFEGKKKMALANQGIEKLRKQVDTLIIIPNQNLLDTVDNNMPIKQAFILADSALLQSVQGISDLITEPGEINIDFADVKSVMKGKGDAHIGMGFGEGQSRAMDAATHALNNPLMENTRIDGATSVLINVAGCEENLTLYEFNEIVDFITQSCAEDAMIISGQSYNPTLGERIKVTLIATGFGEKTPSTSYGRDSAGLYGSPIETRSKKKEEEVKRNEDETDASTITVNRWQDLQQQLGRRAANPGDFSIPAVLRYGRDDSDDDKRGK